MGNVETGDTAHCQKVPEPTLVSPVGLEGLRRLPGGWLREPDMNEA